MGSLFWVEHACDLCDAQKHRCPVDDSGPPGNLPDGWGTIVLEWPHVGNHRAASHHLIACPECVRFFADGMKNQGPTGRIAILRSIAHGEFHRKQYV